MRANVNKRAQAVRQIVEANVEQGNQQKCRLQVYRRHIYPLFYISERTFWRYMKLADTPPQDGQMKLF